MKCDNVDRSQWRIPVWLVAVTCALVMLLGIGIGISVGKANPAKTGEPQQMQEQTATGEAWRSNILRTDEIPNGYYCSYSAWALVSSIDLVLFHSSSLFAYSVNSAICSSVAMS